MEKRVIIVTFIGLKKKIPRNAISSLASFGLKDWRGFYVIVVYVSLIRREELPRGPFPFEMLIG